MSTNGRMDTTNLIVTFRNFAVAPKNENKTILTDIYNLISVERKVLFMNSGWNCLYD